MRHHLSVLTVGAFAGAALLVPSAASAKTHSYWSATHSVSDLHSRVSDPSSDIAWTILDHKIILTTPELLVVPFVYTCGTTTDPGGVQYYPGAFQTVFDGATARAFIGGEGTTTFPTFTCDGTRHVIDVALPGQDGSHFENGNIEVGLAEDDTSPTPDPTFEHAVTGYSQLHGPRAKAAVSVNATPEPTKAGSKITVKGTVKRDGKAYNGKHATLYFQSKDGDPATKIGSARADSRGKLSTRVTVTGPGTYFWTTTSTSKTQAGASLGDYVATS